jgi:hypothetical protein
VCPSVRLPRLVDGLFEGISCVRDAPATVLKPCPWLRGDRHGCEFTDDSLPSRRYLSGPLLVRRCAVGTFHARLKIKNGPQMVDLRFDYERDFINIEPAPARAAKTQ